MGALVPLLKGKFPYSKLIFVDQRATVFLNGYCYIAHSGSARPRRHRLAHAVAYWRAQICTKT